jgi:hypothetical protein
VKKTAITLFCSLWLPLQAQFTGGSGDGDFKSGTGSKLLNGSAGTAAWYFGGNGDGDIKASVTTKQLDGTTAVLAWFYGGSGDGDNKASGTSILLGGTPAVAAWFFGGSGDGDIKSTRLTNSFLGDIEWIGSSSINWNTAANWRQNALPTNGRIKISPSAVRDLYLDQNRTVEYIEFNNAGVEVCLENFNLTVQGRLIGANAANYIKTTGTGKLTMAVGNGSTLPFPVGKSAYNPLIVTNKTGASDNFSVRVDDAVYTNGNSGTVASGLRVNRTWHIDKSVPTANAGDGVDLVFQWNSSEESAGMSQYYLNHHNGSGWVFATGYGGSQAVSGTTTKTLTFTGYKGGFSPFAIGGDPVSPLPIVLREFTASCAEEGVTLNWTTESEINNERFFVQRSADLMQWEEVLALPGAGNSNAPLSYSAADERPLGGISYYRLGQQDYDGTTELFDPVSIYCQTELSGDALHVYPNPAEEMFTVSLYLSEHLPEANFQLVDLNGRLVASHSFSGLKGNNTFQINRQGVESGTYVLRVMSEKTAVNPVKVVLK